MLKLGIIGHPLKHSLSPLLHTLLMQLMGLEGEYRPYELEPAALEEGFRELGERGVRGVNVTIPHKVTVMPFLDHIDPEARLIGAVNTVVFEEAGEQVAGYNTDVIGFIRSLPETIIRRLPESNVLVLGAGGSARAVMSALIQLGAAAVTVAVRNPEKAVPFTGQGELIKQFYQESGAFRTELHIVSLYSLPSLEGFDCLVNTTPVGMWPDTDTSPLSAMQLQTLPAGALVYDLIYRPLETRLMHDARAHGLQAVNGLEMLLQQAIASFEYWQERKVPDDTLEPLRQQLEQALL